MWWWTPPNRRLWPYLLGISTSHGALGGTATPPECGAPARASRVRPGGCRSPPAQARLVRSGPTHAGHVIRELYMAAPHMTATCGRGRDDYCRPCGAAGNAERRDVAAVACAHAWSMVDVWFSTEYIMHVHRRRQRESYLARCRRKASARDRYRSPVYIDAASPVSYRRPVHWLLIWCMCMLRYALAMFWKCPVLLPL